MRRNPALEGGLRVKLRQLRRAVFQRFDDPRIEARYRLEQRQRQARFTRAMVLIAAAMFGAYSLLHPLLIGWSDAVGVQLGFLPIVPLLIGYGWYVVRPGYPNNRWIDIALFVGVQPGMHFAARAFADTGASDWSFGPMLTYNSMVVLAFACLAYAASVRRFFGLTLASIVYLPTILFLEGGSASKISYTAMFYATYAMLILYVNWAIDDKARGLFAAQTRLDQARQRSDRLLDNMLPKPVAERLKSHESIADAFEDIAVVFVDLVGFAALSQRLDPARLVELLDAFFERADHGTDLFGLEKVKTIGDAYMAVAGALTRPPRPAKAAVDFAVWLRREAREVGRSYEIDLRLHVGIAEGPAIGGVTGAKRLSYDYWGHTVNLAARLQDSVGADGIAVSEPVWRAVRDSYPFHEPRSMVLKGVGATLIFDVDLPA